MLGQLIFEDRGGGKAERAQLYGLTVLRARADPEGWLGQRRLRKAGRALRRGGALRTLAPAGFQQWELLEACGLTSVSPLSFLRAQGAPLALGALERQGLAPDRAAVMLKGERVDRELVRTAVTLCPQVRHLVIDAPRGEGNWPPGCGGSLEFRCCRRRSRRRSRWALVPGESPRGNGERACAWYSMGRHPTWPGCRLPLRPWPRRIRASCRCWLLCGKRGGCRLRG